LACNAVRSFWTLSGVFRVPNLLSFPTCCVGLEPRPLPSIGITRLHRYYGPLRHPIAPGLALAGFQLVSRLTTQRGFPCCVCLPLSCMPSPIPRRNHRFRFAHFSCDSGLPRPIAGSASALVFSRPAQRSLALWPACSPSPLRTLYIRGFSRFVASTTALIATGWSESCRTGFAPVEKQRLSHGALFLSPTSQQFLVL